MLIKSADDKSKRIALLESLQDSPKLDARQKTWAREELVRLRRGMQGERDAAHYLDNYFADGKNYAVIHDLRLVDGEDTAQIDHLVVGRTFEFYLLETKNFNGSLRINDVGEFSVRYAGQRDYGIPSPLEQSRRHERVLLRTLDKLGVAGRVSKRPTFHHIVLMHPTAIISRPPTKAFDTSMVIKADQFRAWHERHVEKESGIASALTGLMNVRSSETVESWGKLLARLHRPVDQLALPEFMAPKAAPSTPAAPPPAKPERKLICATCGSKISFAEGKYCWNNEARFGGLQYCREHQAEFR